MHLLADFPSDQKSASRQATRKGHHWSLFWTQCARIFPDLFYTCTVKQVSDFPVLSRDVTNQTLPGRLVTSRFETGKSGNLFYSVSSICKNLVLDVLLSLMHICLIHVYSISYSVKWAYNCIIKTFFPRDIECFIIIHFCFPKLPLSAWFVSLFYVRNI